MIRGRFLLATGLQWCRCRVSCHIKRHYSFLPDDVKSLRAVANPDISKIRNIGIMAHIDAGKTTTTERMLYYSGYTRALGDVDDGDTVTDFMAQERERGITIQSAAVTFDWKSHRINLIDTPGHVDFTLEVERALRVLDGAVAVFDASAGVEAQTLTVWRQAEKHHVPCVCFLNKMDKPTANLSFSIESIRQKLKANPVLLQIPVGCGKNFSGVVDLLTNQKLIWKPKSVRDDDGRMFESKPLDQSDEPELLQEVSEARAALIEQVADLDDDLAELLLTDFSDNFNAVPSIKLQEAVRRVTLARKGVPVLCGSSLRNKGVQPLLDAITAYLPAPDERHHDLVRWYKDELCALAFKVLHDKQRGPLVFLRIYSGTLKSQTAVHNINRNSVERMSRLMVPFADQHVEIPSMTAGNIALTVGLKQTVTGDTITSSKASAAAAARRAQKDGGAGKKRGENATVVLSGVEVPDPVFFCTIEPPTMAKQADLDNALNCLQREDPSLKVRLDPESGQTILCGMGELHIEIIHDRIRREYGIETHLGPLQVAYRESILHEVSTTDTLDRTIGERRHIVTVGLAVAPLDISATGDSCEVAFTEELAAQLPPEMKEAVENGVNSSYLQGPLLGYPVQGVSTLIQSVNMQPGTSPAMVSACVSRCMLKALRLAGGQILEPLMSLEVTVGEERLSSVLGDLAQRRGTVQDIQSRQDDKVLLATVPLAEMMGYSTILRTLTSGNATFSLELDTYETMNPQDQNTLVKRMSGLL
ncbi:ribosome-releasing factor 2, mitochondrial isoform X1 [Centropristis striata]|uniref:ribosome-releasing factor 2, mitochondrial isoform X1 n=1 Tax=Centropristis striata TaxID=184440 RepID=UPI0027DFECAE|nr:ribosome-releasing factor 2, mitochondrial isoform X1 [Centropristis striata]